MNIFDTKYCILFCYPKGASGKFVLNSLAMNSNFLLQIPFNLDNNLKYLGNYEEYPLIQLKNFIKSKKSKSDWKDFGTGDNLFFGTKNIVPPGIHEVDPDLESYKQQLKISMSTAAYGKKYFFRICHNQHAYNFYRKIWKNAHTINFINCSKWLHFRNKQLSIRDQYPIENKISDIESNLEFNVETLFDFENFINEYTKILNYFGLRIENIELITEFYQTYVNFLAQPD